ncbi:MAG: META domain-containing protein [Pseudomonadota bacterium]
MTARRCSVVIFWALLAVACGRDGSSSAGAAPAYLPESVREARALEAEQAAKIAAATTGRAWSVIDISGQAMIEGSDAGLAFGNDMTVSGSAGCNGFNGEYTLESAQLSFGPLATTRKLCADPIMKQERIVLDTLGQVISAGVDEDGLLFLSTLNGDVIKLVPRDTD